MLCAFYYNLRYFLEMLRNTPVDQVAKWMHGQFKQFPNEEADQEQFIKSKYLFRQTVCR